MRFLQGEYVRESEVAWTRVAFMENTLIKIRRYGTQSVMKVDLSQSVM